MIPGRRPCTRAPLGFTTLTIVALLLVIGSLAMLFLNRSLVQDLRGSVSQARGAEALHAAEAGIDWAIAMLNRQEFIDAQCQPDPVTKTNFRQRYLATGSTASPADWNLSIAPDVAPGCALLGPAPACHCPPSAPTPVVAALPSASAPHFTVRFARIAGMDDAVQLTAIGCPAASAVCHDAASADQADARATVRVVVKLVPRFRAVPSSALTCGTSCALGGAYQVANHDVPSNGVAINAGTTATLSPGTTVETLAGVPRSSAVVAPDDSLSRLSSTDPDCRRSSIFRSYFGTSVDDFRRSPATLQIGCGSAADCRQQLEDGYARGYTGFFFTTDLQLSGNGQLGTRDRPVTLVTEQALHIDGTWDVWGLLFSNSADINDLGTGSATVHGAQITCAAYANNGHGTTRYDADALKSRTLRDGTAVRVPGSWRDS